MLDNFKFILALLKGLRWTLESIIEHMERDIDAAEKSRNDVVPEEQQRGEHAG